MFSVSVTKYISKELCRKENKQDVVITRELGLYCGLYDLSVRAE